MKNDKPDESVTSSTTQQTQDKCEKIVKPVRISMFSRILRLWRNFLILLILLCIASIPLVLFLIGTTYTVQAAIKVESAQENILTGEIERGVGETFMKTQSIIITSDPIRNKVVDKLYDRNLPFLLNDPFDPVVFLKKKLKGVEIVHTPEERLKKAVADGIITAAPSEGTDLIYVTMTSESPHEARLIVDAFIEAYMAIEVVSSVQAEEMKLKVLEDTKKAITEKIRNYRKDKIDIARQFGSGELTLRQEMKLERVSMLYNQVTEYEALVIQIGAKVKVLQKKVELLELNDQIADPNAVKYVADVDDPDRTAYINLDSQVVSLIADAARFKRMLMEVSLSLKPDDPESKRKKEILAQLQGEVDARKEEVGKVYDGMKEKEFVWKGKQKLIKAKNDLETAKADLELKINTKLQFELLLKDEDIETRDVGLVQLAIQERDDLLKLEEEQYGRIARRIQEMEMESKRPERITVAYNADVVSKRDYRVKIIVALAAAILVSLLLLWIQRRIRKNITKAELTTIDEQTEGKTTTIITITTTKTTTTTTETTSDQEKIEDKQPENNE